MHEEIKYNCSWSSCCDSEPIISLSSLHKCARDYVLQLKCALMLCNFLPFQSSFIRNLCFIIIFISSFELGTSYPINVLAEKGGSGLLRVENWERESIVEYQVIKNGNWDVTVNGPYGLLPTPKYWYIMTVEWDVTIHWISFSAFALKWPIHSRIYFPMVTITLLYLHTFTISQQKHTLK